MPFASKCGFCNFWRRTPNRLGAILKMGAQRMRSIVREDNNDDDVNLSGEENERKDREEETIR